MTPEEIKAIQDNARDRANALVYMEKRYKWRENIGVIPFIKFPADWEIQIIGPFSGAQCRFRVRRPDHEVKSVYLDMNCELGYFCDADGNEAAYWEVYPVDGDIGRCGINEVDQLLDLIRE